MSSTHSNGIRSILSNHGVDETLARIQRILESKAVKLFAVIDHSGEAEKAGMHMPPTKLLIFGNPSAGTPLMLGSPSTAIDLPLKLLVAEDESGQVTISWNDPSWLQQRHGFSAELLQNIAVIDKLAESAGA